MKSSSRESALAVVQFRYFLDIVPSMCHNRHKAYLPTYLGRNYCYSEFQSDVSYES